MAADYVECIYCPARFDTPLEMESHLNRWQGSGHHPMVDTIKETGKDGELQWFGCPICPYTANLKSSVEDHLATVHRTTEAPVSVPPVSAPTACARCNLLFQTTAECDAHMKWAHPYQIHKPVDLTLPPLFACGYCAKKFSTQGDCVGHMIKDHHNQPSKPVDPPYTPFACPFCPFVGMQESLKTHLTQEHFKYPFMEVVPEKLTWTCVECNLGFQTQAECDTHIERGHRRHIETETTATQPSPTSKAKSSHQALFYHLISPETIRRLALRKTVGGKKYGIVQWRIGINDVAYVADRYNHLWQHLLAFQQHGNRDDDNLGAMLWALDCLIEVERLCPDVLSQVIGTSELWGPTAAGRHEAEMVQKIRATAPPVELKDEGDYGILFNDGIVEFSFDNDAAKKVADERLEANEAARFRDDTGF